MTRPGLSDEARFWMKVEKSETCWNWTAAKKATGYGIFNPRNAPTQIAHRFAYKATKGEVTPGMLVDHLCRNRACVNPDHLRLVTPGQNAENQDGHSDSRSGRRGVTCLPNGKWRATVTKNGKNRSVGPFDDLEEAAEAARQLRLELHTHNTLDRVA